MAKQAASKAVAASKKPKPVTKAAPKSRVSKTTASKNSGKMAPAEKAKLAAKVKAAAAAPQSKKKAVKTAAPKKPESKPAAAVNKRAAAEPAERATPPAFFSGKRKATPTSEEAQREEDELSPPQKKVKSTPASRKPKAVPAPRKFKFGPSINKAPDAKLDIFVCGEGTSGELGLGHMKVDGKKPIDVRRPRLNESLGAQKVGVVQIAAGGMHVAALTYDNKIMTWGVNDQGSLGRDTTWEGGLKDIDDDKSDSSDTSDDADTGLNPLESTPSVVEDTHFPEGTKFVQVAASDSATFTLTKDGSVYGWGTFRGNDGIIGFSEKSYIQRTPTIIPELKRITKIATGSNHVLALDNKGHVYAWGAGQQNQLGRRVVERTRVGGLTPREFGLPRGKIVDISCGAYHSFAIDNKGKVWTWGLNNFGETGVFEGAGEDNAVIFKPTVVTALESYRIKEIRGGAHHSLACTEDGKCLVWGRADGSQAGIPIGDIPKEDLVYDERGSARILAKPTILTIPSKSICSVAAGSDNSFAIDTTGRAYSWGFSANYQTGQGTDSDVPVPTLIDNTAVRNKKLIGAAAGGQYSIVYGEHEVLVNGSA